jgi:hypothetical protein
VRLGLNESGPGRCIARKEGVLHTIQGEGRASGPRQQRPPAHSAKRVRGGGERGTHGVGGMRLLAEDAGIAAVGVVRINQASH